MTKMRVAAGVLAMACLGTNAIADSADDNGTTTVCHKGRTVTINESGLRGHLGHGDSEGSCEDRRSAVVMMQCVAQGEGIVVYAVSNSPFVDEGVVPVAGEDCATALATMIDANLELGAVTSGSNGTTDYLLTGYVSASATP
ncbi:MAG: hypothetical protein H6988_00350 [Pseudomonadales bacterium]|nr:hypothetical protein [Halieaceae bacterium]MCP5164718.1 hypothetical protein [Pseudomonadales bacterium]MCP5188828.1 hypothetical protein [Pseudomonadales bacterium]MCP5203184.1 hypothetical protein [Pseudomonadales bacterium]